MSRVLVVDDDLPSRELALYLLRSFGHEAWGAQDAVAGLRLAREAPFDVVLVDVLMPKIGGFEFARSFRAEHCLDGVPLIALTALAMVGDRDRMLSSGFDGYLSKPIDPERFAEIVGGLARSRPAADPSHVMDVEVRLEVGPREVRDGDEHSLVDR